MIAVIGGAGSFGKGLAMRWAVAGEDVIIGSRWRDKAEKAAAEMSEKTGKKIQGSNNFEAASRATVIVLSVPFKAVKKILNEISTALTPGKILVDVTVPLELRQGSVLIKRLKAGSAAEELARKVPKGVKVVSAFQTIAAENLRDISKPVDSDVIICGDDDDAKLVVMNLAEKITGAGAIDGGPLRNSRFLEPIVALLIEFTKRRKVKGVGIRFKGL
jgi:NADPH-dependent F420 reductase